MKKDEEKENFGPHSCSEKDANLKPCPSATPAIVHSPDKNYTLHFSCYLTVLGWKWVRAF